MRLSGTEQDLSGLGLDFVYELVHDSRELRLDLRRGLQRLLRFHQVLSDELDRLVGTGLAIANETLHRGAGGCAWLADDSRLRRRAV